MEVLCSLLRNIREESISDEKTIRFLKKEIREMELSLQTISTEVSSIESQIKEKEVFYEKLKCDSLVVEIETLQVLPKIWEAKKSEFESLVKSSLHTFPEQLSEQLVKRINNSLDPNANQIFDNFIKEINTILTVYRKFYHHILNG